MKSEYLFLSQLRNCVTNLTTRHLYTFFSKNVSISLTLETDFCRFFVTYEKLRLSEL